MRTSSHSFDDKMCDNIFMIFYFNNSTWKSRWRIWSTSPERCILGAPPTTSYFGMISETKINAQNVLRLHMTFRQFTSSLCDSKATLFHDRFPRRKSHHFARAVFLRAPAPWAVLDIVFQVMTFAVGEFESELCVLWCEHFFVYATSHDTHDIVGHYDLRETHHVLRVDGATFRIRVDSVFNIPIRVPLRQIWGRVSRLSIDLREHLGMTFPHVSTCRYDMYY